MRSFLLLALASSLAVGHAAAQSGADARAAARRHREANEAKILREFSALLSLPNVASNRDDIRRNADHLMGMLRQRGATAQILEAAAECGAEARAAAETDLERLDLTQRDADQRLRRAQRGAEREELLASLEELAAWYRDLVVVATGAESAAIHSDRLAALGEDATIERLAGAERACEVVRQVWRELEEFNLNPELALESLFVRLRRELGANLIYES